VRAGAFPLLLNTAAYCQFADDIGCPWLRSWMVEQPTVECIRDAMLKAWADPPWMENELMTALQVGIARESYQWAWDRAKLDIEGLVGKGVR
jgi:hypothetical protein